MQMIASSNIIKYQYLIFGLIEFVYDKIYDICIFCLFIQMLILLIFILPVLACDLCLENGVFMWGINGNMEFSPLTKTVKYCVGIFQCSSNICEIFDNTSGVTSIILGDFGEAGAHKTVLLYNYNCTNNLTIISRNKNYNLISSASCKDMMDCNSAMCELLLNTDAQYLQIVQH